MRAKQPMFNKLMRAALKLLAEGDAEAFIICVHPNCSGVKDDHAVLAAIATDNNKVINAAGHAIGVVAIRQPDIGKALQRGIRVAKETGGKVPEGGSKTYDDICEKSETTWPSEKAKRVLN